MIVKSSFYLFLCSIIHYFKAVAFVLFIKPIQLCLSLAQIRSCQITFILTGLLLKKHDQQIYIGQYSTCKKRLLEGTRSFMLSAIMFQKTFTKRFYQIIRSSSVLGLEGLDPSGFFRSFTADEQVFHTVTTSKLLHEGGFFLLKMN